MMGELGSALVGISISLLGLGLLLSVFGVGKILISASVLLMLIGLCGGPILTIAMSVLAVFCEWLLKVILAAAALFVLYRLMRWLLNHI